MSKPLEGIKVVEAAMWVFGPATGAILADLGADVIKVEHPEGGDPQRALRHKELSALGWSPWVSIANRGKRSVGLDLRHEDGRLLLGRLIGEADVFLTSFLPDARRRMRLEPADVRKDNPDVIYARASGAGPFGPEAERGGYDMAAAWGRGGTAFKLTPPGGEPPPMPASFFDLAGAVALAGAIGTALFRRERTGQPSIVDTSLLNTAMWPLAPDIVMGPHLGQLTTRERLSPGNPTVNWYRTSDSRWLYLVHIQSDRFWGDLCEKLGHPELADDPRFGSHQARIDNQQACVAALDAVFATRTLAEWTPVLNQTAGVWAPVQSPAELYDDPMVRSNGYLQEVTGQHGAPVSVVAPPAQFDEQPSGPATRAPEAGEHTDEVLLELGLSWDEIIDAKVSGAVQ